MPGDLIASQAVDLRTVGALLGANQLQKPLRLHIAGRSPFFTTIRTSYTATICMRMRKTQKILNILNSVGQPIFPTSQTCDPHSKLASQAACKRADAHGQEEQLVLDVQEVEWPNRSHRSPPPLQHH